jgi:small GTP-binding protein
MADPLSSMLRCNVVLLGDAGVGKTTLMLRYQGLSTKNINATIGADYAVIRVPIDPPPTSPRTNRVALCIWDISGQPDYTSLIPTSVRSVDVCLVHYAQDSRDSFEHCSGWIEKVLTHAENPPLVVLVATKSDLPATVTAKEGKAFADSVGASFIQTSAVSEDGRVNELYQKLVAAQYASRPGSDIKAATQTKARIDPAAIELAPTLRRVDRKTERTGGCGC